MLLYNCDSLLLFSEHCVQHACLLVCWCNTTKDNWACSHRLYEQSSGPGDAAHQQAHDAAHSLPVCRAANRYRHTTAHRVKSTQRASRLLHLHAVNVRSGKSWSIRQRNASLNVFSTAYRRSYVHLVQQHTTTLKQLAGRTA
eukprot:8317-Heterococcus_DN1.PRE.2